MHCCLIENRAPSSVLEGLPPKAEKAASASLEIAAVTQESTSVAPEDTASPPGARVPPPGFTEEVQSSADAADTPARPEELEESRARTSPVTSRPSGDIRNRVNMPIGQSAPIAEDGRVDLESSDDDDDDESELDQEDIPENAIMMLI